MSQPIVDYVIARDDSPGMSGLAYDYVLAGDGVFVAAENDVFAVRIPIASVQIRGLPSIGPMFEMKGRIPAELFHNFAEIARGFAQHGREVLGLVVLEGDTIALRIPVQVPRATRISYRRPSVPLALEIHSHHRFPARFSCTDNQDEQGLGIFAVIGSLDKSPEVALRVGVHGHFMPLAWEDVFDGEVGDFHDTSGIDIAREPLIKDEDDEYEGPPQSLLGFFARLNREISGAMTEEEDS